MNAQEVKDLAAEIKRLADEYGDTWHNPPLYTEEFQPRQRALHAAIDRLASLAAVPVVQPPVLPLTDEQITDLWPNVRLDFCEGNDVIEFARAIEAAVRGHLTPTPRPYTTPAGTQAEPAPSLLMKREERESLSPEAMGVLTAVLGGPGSAGAVQAEAVRKRATERMFAKAKAAGTPPMSPGGNGPNEALGSDETSPALATPQPNRGLLQATRQADEPAGWLPTAAKVNALSEPIRRYVHDLETLCDPAGIVRDNTIMRDQVRELSASNRVLRDALAACRRVSDKRCSELERVLRIAEAALADIGDADREPLDGIAWCERRAAQALPAVRAAIAAVPKPEIQGSDHPAKR